MPNRESSSPPNISYHHVTFPPPFSDGGADTFLSSLFSFFHSSFSGQLHLCSIRSSWLAFETSARALTSSLREQPPSIHPAPLSAPQYCGGSSPPQCAQLPAPPARELPPRQQSPRSRPRLCDMHLDRLRHSTRRSFMACTRRTEPRWSRLPGSRCRCNTPT